MFSQYFQTLQNCFKVGELRSRIFFTLSLLVVCRLVSMVPLPGLDGAILAEFFTNLKDEQDTPGLLGMYSMFTGGALERCAVGSLGIMPYISATIILQLMTAVVPSLSKLAREEGGRTQIIKYGRYLTVLLCLGQGIVMSMGWEHPERIPGFGDSDFWETNKLVSDGGWWYLLRTTLLLTTGTVLLMWLGEQISERGIGNGISLVITVGIIARVDMAVLGAWEMFFPAPPAEGAHPFKALILLGLLLAVVGVVIAVTQAMRKIPVQYAQRNVGRKMYQGGSTYFPLRVNYAGVMPIIFAQAILMFPAQILGTLGNYAGEQGMAGMGDVLSSIGDQLAYGSGWNLFMQGLMILFFSYFWVATQFNETQIADDLKKAGGYIPGVRPGNATRDFLHHAMSRLTLAGAIFLVVIAVIPTVLAREEIGNIPFPVAQFFGGTSLLIMVGVMLDTMRQMESHLAQHHYDGFLKSGKVRGRF
ncbi:MAG: preprotein translocase subunit SecY [Verrucomicrobiota bacterium]|jgi:preprotein translocase subunit SecY|nr:preprotein translocase subunit SecY [Verrucomicrobiota bacterium]